MAAKKDSKKPVTEEGKILIIAEKPSVANDISSAIKEKFTKEKTHFEGEKTLISWSVGHLLTISTPAEMDERFKSWDIENLPILPQNFLLKPIPSTKSQLSALIKLVKNKEVTTIINACDAGREGELIFRYILQYAGEAALKNKVLKRLWLQSMTPAAIREGLENLKPDHDLLGLFDAAKSRSEADWLIGINGSRALTGYKNRFGGFFLTPCGRVQTPTLSVIVQRELERRRFIPEPYFEVWGQFQYNSQQYIGKWFDPEELKKKEVTQTQAERIVSKEKADAIYSACIGQLAVVEDKSKVTQQGSPLLYDLTSIQREANGRFGMSAKHTLDIIQRLYERHKVVTYPRTDSRHLPQSDIGKVREVMVQLSQSSLGKFADKVVREEWIVPTKKVFDDTKVSDHHAIIPTGTLSGNLDETEKKIFLMIAQRFIAIFFPPAKILNTTRLSVVGEHTFRTEGKVIQEAGWREVYGNEMSEEGEMPPIHPSDTWKMAEGEVKSLETKPPSRYNESSLLSVMEGAGKLIDDEELREVMKERGLGTAATRAGIIEGLIKDKYLVRQGKDLVPTPKAEELMEMLVRMKIEELSSPEMTGEWEYRLEQIAKGKEVREKFMNDISQLATRLVQKVRDFNEESEENKAEVFVHEKSGKKILETLSFYEPEDKSFRIRKFMGGRYINPEELKILLDERKLGPLTGFVSKAGKPFSAVIVLNSENKAEFVFESNTEEAPNFEEKEPLGLSPIDQSPVYEDTMSYVSKSYFDEDNKSGLKINKMILGKEISPENLQKMLAGEKSELIKGFISTKTKRPFDAFLELDNKGKLKFSFPPRTGKKFGWGKKKAAA